MRNSGSKRIPCPHWMDVPNGSRRRGGGIRSTERGALNDLGELTDGASLEPRAADELRSILVGRVVREAEPLSRTLLVERGALTDGVESESLPGLTLRSLLEGLADRGLMMHQRFSIVRVH